MSRFQRVTLVQLVLSIREPRCSARPAMCWDGREVDSCRNWSAKNRGATVVFSLQEEPRRPCVGGGGPPRETPGLAPRGGPGWPSTSLTHWPWGRSRHWRPGDPGDGSQGWSTPRALPGYAHDAPGGCPRGDCPMRRGCKQALRLSVLGAVPSSSSQGPDRSQTAAPSCARARRAVPPGVAKAP